LGEWRFAVAESETRKRARRIEADPRTDEFVLLFQRYGETVLGHIARSTGHEFDPTMLLKVNREVEPMLRSRIEALVKDYLVTAYESLTGEPIDSEEVGYRVQFPRRRRYHLRFLALSFSDLIAFDEKALVVLPDGKKMKKGETSAAVFPKSILEGIDAWSRAVLGKIDIEAANMTAFRALDRLDISAECDYHESDRDLWRRLHELPDAMALICPILMPLLVPFHEDFEGARTQMQRLIGAGSEGRVQLNAKMWDLLFARIFGRLLRYIGAEERPDFAAEIDPGARLAIAQILVNYRRWRAENQLK
jgi:hypothetical protein